MKKNKILDNISNGILLILLSSTAALTTACNKTDIKTALKPGTVLQMNAQFCDLTRQKIGLQGYGNDYEHTPIAVTFQIVTNQTPFTVAYETQVDNMMPAAGQAQSYRVRITDQGSADIDHALADGKDYVFRFVAANPTKSPTVVGTASTPTTGTTIFYGDEYKSINFDLAF